MLPPGARIAVCAPSGIFVPERLEAGLGLLREWGYAPEVLPGVGARAHRYLAADDTTRLRDLQAALCGRWDAAWMVRGGYGIAPLLPRLELDDVRVPFFGFSDGTALLNPLADRGHVAVHAPVLQSLADHCDDASRAHLRALLAGEPIEPLAGRTLRRGDAEGSLAGGNLCMLASMCGTPWQLRGKTRIVVLEEVGEVPYKVDRLLTQLLEAGCFDGVAGFALGTFLGAAVPEGAEWEVLDVVRDRLAPLGVPILAGLPIGHGPSNRAFPFGPARIEGDRLVIG